MKPAARIQSVLEILDAIFEGKKPADTLIGDYFKARRYAGSKDRRFITSTVYDILRNRAKLTWMTEQIHASPLARHLVLAYCAHNDLEVSDFFTGEQYAPAELNDQEKRDLGVLAELNIEQTPDHIRFEYPEWLDQDLKTSLGDNFEEAMTALNQEAPLDMRINRLHPDAESAQSLLSKQNIETEIGKYSPICLRSQKKVKLGGIKAYKEGLIDIQDEGSQLIAALCNAKGKELVIDFCAGAGGKTLALAGEMENKGHLYALDISGQRLYKMRRRLERADVANVILNPIKAENDPWLKQFENRADCILVDAPCSGVGAWRRTPESRWKLTPELLEDMTGRQERILKNAAHLVKKGGRLVYATCSLLERENQKQVERFLSANDEFTLVPIQQAWQETLQTDCPFTTDYMTMRPDLHQSDGFFCAVLERKA